MDKVNGYGMYHDYGGRGLKRSKNLRTPEKTEKFDKSSETKAETQGKRFDYSI